MRKNKFLKTFGFTSLALLMACTGVVAFAPLGIGSAQEQTITTTGLGLDPKNDPVVYTTESGLEIRMSNANKITGTSTLTNNLGTNFTQDLTSFYYFTMGKYSGTLYTSKSTTDTFTVTNEPLNWIILGLGENASYFLDEVSKNLFSTWKNNMQNIGEYSNVSNLAGEYFFSDIYETYSPAGQLIDSAVSAKTYIMDKVKASIVNHPDIPEGCMLVISEKILGQAAFTRSGSSLTFWTSEGTGHFLRHGSPLGCRYLYNGNNTAETGGRQSWTISGNAGGTLYNAVNNLFSKNASTGAIVSNLLNFNQTQANLIVPQQLYTYFSNGQGYNYHETPESDGGTYYTMFPLASRGAYSSTYQNFCIEDYLTTNTQRIASLLGSTQSDFWWLRSGYPWPNFNNVACEIEPSGNLSSGIAHDFFGIRPAMVMKLQ